MGGGGEDRPSPGSHPALPRSVAAGTTHACLPCCQGLLEVLALFLESPVCLSTCLCSHSITAGEFTFPTISDGWARAGQLWASLPRAPWVTEEEQGTRVIRSGAEMSRRGLLLAGVGCG